MVIFIAVFSTFVTLMGLAVLIFCIFTIIQYIKDREIFPSVILSILGFILAGFLIALVICTFSGITHCRNCHKFYWDSTYCEICGDKLRDTVNCHNCGKEFNGKGNYCPYCGYSVRTKEKTTDDE